MSLSVQNDALNLPLPSRPRMMSHQSNSLPSTPRQLARDYGAASRTPSPGHRTGSTSPRSVTSDSNRPMPALRLAPTACRFMSTQTSRRRIPYTIGTDLLENDNDKIKATLNVHEEEKLSGDMRELYDRLLPTLENEAKREKVLDKLRNILAKEWPGRDIEVAMFGSSGNLLFTSKSDVDVCVTMKDIDTTCVIADALARHGMQNVTCVHAKAVPIVKVWDPELQLACDLNLNNNVALTNTRMVKTYIQLDERVRPLAMIVKYWTKRRIINEASGGTLSSYTWTLLLINFLQTRNPPVLPTLQVRDSRGKPRNDFSQDLEAYRGFGLSNKETLGELLFHFFRRYGHEMDYNTAVISVRNGTLLTKEEKNWQLATNNMLCVEEPFNTDRNLANTADDTAFRGLHLEFRQAFERIAAAKDIVSSVCEQFTFPSGDTKPVFFERPQPQPRAVITRSRSQSNRGGTNNGTMRGNRHQSNPRAGHSGRRASSAADYVQNMHPVFNNSQVLYSPDFIICAPGQEHQQQVQSQQGLQDQLSRLSQRLSQEEHRLRAQQLLITQAQLQQAQAQVQAHAATQNRSSTFTNRLSSSHTYRSPRANALEDPPAIAPLQRTNAYGSHFESPGPSSHSPSQQGTDTNPSSPQLTSSVPLRRNVQRGAIPTSSSTPIRSHSQPARSLGQQSLNSYPRAQFVMPTTNQQPARQDFVVPNGVQGQTFIGPFVGPYGPFYIPSTSVIEPFPREYLGYGYGATPSLMSSYADQVLPQIPAFDDLQRQGSLPSDMHEQENLPFTMADPSRSPSPLDTDEVYLNGHSPKIHADSSQSYLGTSFPTSLQPALAGPVIVNGSHASVVKSLESHKPYSSPQRRASDPFGHFGTNSSTVPVSAILLDDLHLQKQNKDNSSERGHNRPHASSGDLAAPDGRTNTPQAIFTPGGVSRAVSVSPNGHLTSGESTPAAISPTSRLSPDSQHDRRTTNGISRPTMTSLDFGTNNFEFSRETTHSQSTLLSPVRETPTPSPTSDRKVEREKSGAYMNGIAGGKLPLPVKLQSESRDDHPPPTPAPTLAPGGLGNGLANKQEHHDAASSSDDRKSSRIIGGNASSSTTASGNTWQLAAGKKGRKARSSNPSFSQGENRATGQAEAMPVNGAERKGG